MADLSDPPSPAALADDEPLHGPSVRQVPDGDDRRFADWRYRRDPTHVVFYRAATFRYLARGLGLDCRRVALDVVLLRRPGAGGGSPTLPTAAAVGAGA